MLSVAKAFPRHIKCPAKSIDFATNFGTSLFQPQSNLPDSSREVGTYQESKHILSTTPGGHISDQKSLYAPIIPLHVSVPGPGGWGFQLTSALKRTQIYMQLT